jgi:tetratricopeptide (TPR) repeat protein
MPASLIVMQWSVLQNTAWFHLSKPCQGPKAAALKALEFDPTLAEAQTQVAHVTAFYEWDVLAAEREFRRAIELNSDYAFAHHWYALYLSAVEQHERALSEERRAQETRSTFTGHKQEFEVLSFTTPDGLNNQSLNISALSNSIRTLHERISTSGWLGDKLANISELSPN